MMKNNEAYLLRRNNDLDKLHELQKQIPNLLKVISISGNPVSKMYLRFEIPTAKDSAFPESFQSFSEAEITLNENYPLPPGPMVYFKTPIWNPNVYPSRKYCYGEWTVTETLDFFVIRLMKIIALDPIVTNPNSAADLDAAIWYKDKIFKSPGLFPTLNIEEHLIVKNKPKITWRTVK